jgi:PQQ-dependent catabolism-associated CXXCW motif protein
VRDTSRLTCLALVAALIGSPLLALDEPAGYRQSEYDAPVPDGVSGGLRIEDEAAFALWHSGVVTFFDVMPGLKRPKGLPEDAIWKGRSRDSIPGAIWLPDAGFGTLDTKAEAGFRAALEAATKGRLDAPMVFFCRADCWMSWNASRRAISWGYTRVFWYAFGTTGWEFNGYPTQRIKPASPGDRP